MIRVVGIVSLLCMLVLVLYLPSAHSPDRFIDLVRRERQAIGSFWGDVASLRILSRVSIVLIITGVLLSTLHQSSLGSLFLIVPNKLYGLWYSPYMPVFFFASAVGAGCGMIILESFLS